MLSQTANPGGKLAPDEVVGRDDLIKRLWWILERRHLYLTGERRMGKTSIIRDKMGSESGDIRFIYMDVSRAISPIEFVERLQEIGAQHLDAKKRLASRLRITWSKLVGTEVGGDAFSLKIPSALASNWKVLLEGLLQDLARLEGRTIIAFDELPLMLDAIRRNTKSGGEAA
ncbi:MAG: ATP-binding protein, partial [Armatimonadetes bacterium]|nr:ATP-binding protein [Armatimonadota bacterium]